MQKVGDVKFLGKRDDARRLMAGFDALVLPSAFEGMPNVVLEAMAAGTPVVASRIAGMTEVVADGETGLLFEPKRPSDLARKVQRLLEEDGLGQQLAENAKKVVGEKFTVEAMTAGYVRLYEGLLGRTKVSSGTEGYNQAPMARIRRSRSCRVALATTQGLAGADPVKLYRQIAKVWSFDRWNAADLTVIRGF